MISNKIYLQTAEKHINEKNILQQKLNDQYPYRLRKEIKNFFNNNENDIQKYDSERALIKKQILSITQKIKYNQDMDFREKNNNDIKIRRQKKKNDLIKKNFDEYYQKIIDEKQNDLNKILDKQKENNIIYDLKTIINKHEETINDLNSTINNQNQIIKEDKKNIFNLNILNKDLQYEIKNLKNSYRINNNSDKISTSSSSNNDDIKKNKININYTEIKELSNYKLNKNLYNMGYKYIDIKDLSYHEKKQLFNKNNNDKITRLFNK